MPEPQGLSFCPKSPQTVCCLCWTWLLWMRQFQPQFGRESDPAQCPLCSSVAVASHDPSAEQSFSGSEPAELIPGPDWPSLVEAPPCGQCEHQREGWQHLEKACVICHHPATLPSATGWGPVGLSFYRQPAPWRTTLSSTGADWPGMLSGAVPFETRWRAERNCYCCRGSG